MPIHLLLIPHPHITLPVAPAAATASAAHSIVIICIFSPLCYALPFTKLFFFFFKYFIYIFSSSDGHVSFSFFESMLAQKHCYIFYLFLNFQWLFSVTLSTCPFASCSFP